MAPNRPAPVKDFETARLDVQNWSARLADPQRRKALEAGLAALLTPAVLAPLPAPLQLANGPLAVSTWVTERAGESDVYVIETKADGALIGLLILAPFAGEDGIVTLHLGYLFGQPAWGQGFATELLSGLIAALAGNGATRLAAGAAADNRASIRVLEKSGFTAAPHSSPTGSVSFTRMVP